MGGRKRDLAVPGHFQVLRADQDLQDVRGGEVQGGMLSHVQEPLTRAQRQLSSLQRNISSRPRPRSDNFQRGSNCDREPQWTLQVKDLRLSIFISRRTERRRLSKLARYQTHQSLMDKVTGCDEWARTYFNVLVRIEICPPLDKQSGACYKQRLSFLQVTKHIRCSRLWSNMRLSLIILAIRRVRFPNPLRKGVRWAPYLHWPAVKYEYIGQSILFPLSL